MFIGIVETLFQAGPRNLGKVGRRREEHDSSDALPTIKLLKWCLPTESCCLPVIQLVPGNALKALQWFAVFFVFFPFFFFSH